MNFVLVLSYGFYFLVSLSVPYFCGELIRSWIFSYPVCYDRRIRAELTLICFSDPDRVRSDIDREDISGWASTDHDTSTLTDSISMRSLMLSDHLSGLIDDGTRFFWDPLVEKITHRYLSDKAESL